MVSSQIYQGRWSYQSKIYKTAPILVKAYEEQYKIKLSIRIHLGIGGKKRKDFIPKALMRTEKVLVRMDAKNPSLAARYNGPYTVLERNDKSFILQLEERTDSVSIDRLVPFYNS